MDRKSNLKARINYSDEQTLYIKEKYLKDPTRATVELLAKELSRTIKSIIGKLSKEGVYRREGYRTKTGEVPVTKAEIVQHIGDILNLNHDTLVGLDKAPKRALKSIESGLELFLGDTND